jgi:hypothetical protein
MNTIFSTDTFRSMFDALPLPVFVVDGDVMVHDYNAAAAGFLLRHVADLGGLYYPVQTDPTVVGLSAVRWRALFCRDAFIGKAVKEAVQGHRVVRRYTRLDAHREGYRTRIETGIQCCPFQNGTRTQVLLVFQEMRQPGERKGVIQICSVCHRIINAKQTLAQLEAYAKEYSGVEFSHGLCPKCYQAEMAKVEAYAFGKPVVHPMKSHGCVEHDRRKSG